MRLFVLALIFFALRAYADQSAPQAEVRVVGERIEFRGLISDETVRAVYELYTAAEIKPTIFEIESAGGTARAAMQLGMWIFENGLDVEVESFCHSSCANYIFTAGANKTLSSEASLIWHGGVTQPVALEKLDELLDRALLEMGENAKQQMLRTHTRSELQQQLRQSLVEIIDMETFFFHRIGVDQRITTLGLFVPVPPLSDGHYIGWDYSLEDLEDLGVRNIRVRNGMEWKPQIPFVNAHTYRVSLKDLPDFHRLPFAPCPLE